MTDLRGVGRQGRVSSIHARLSRSELEPFACTQKVIDCQLLFFLRTHQSYRVSRPAKQYAMSDTPTRSTKYYDEAGEVEVISSDNIAFRVPAYRVQASS